MNEQKVMKMIKYFSYLWEYFDWSHVGIPGQFTADLKNVRADTSGQYWTYPGYNRKRGQKLLSEVYQIAFLNMANWRGIWKGMTY